MGKYDPLRDHLTQLDADIWAARFFEVEQILGFTLPKSAFAYAAWWANDREDGRHMQCLAWLQAGWRIRQVDLLSKNVVFHRKKPLISTSPDSSHLSTHDVFQRKKTRGGAAVAHGWDISEKLQCRLGMEWMPIGRVLLDLASRRLVFPIVAVCPAIYRFRIQKAGKEDRYFGQTDNLARRFNGYRNPGPKQQTNLRLNKHLVRVLSEGADVGIAVVTESAWIDWGDGCIGVDLSSKSLRCALENLAIAEERGVDIESLNR